MDQVRNNSGAPLVFTDDTIRLAAQSYGPRTAIGVSALRAWFFELALRLKRGIRFRSGRNAEACRGYQKMVWHELQAINARQAWANWRTIPRNLSGRLPSRPVRAIDLCCGVGDSTAVLAYYCPPDSRILGLEIHTEFVRCARARNYCNCRNAHAAVEFNAQSVLETFRDSTGAAIGCGSVDVVSASGAVGCHFSISDTQTLARECRRVVPSGGLAMIDAGREGVSPNDLKAIFRDEGFRYVGASKSCVFDRYLQLCFTAG